jgi:hypothetical protein
MALAYLLDGNLALPIRLLNALITTLSNLSNFDTELSLISSNLLEAKKENVDPNSNTTLINEEFRDNLRDALVRLYEEERGEYEKLKEGWAEVEDLRF